MKSRQTEFKKIAGRETAPGGGVLLGSGLIGMCRWMASHFRDWIDYYEVAFL